MHQNDMLNLGKGFTEFFFFFSKYLSEAHVHQNGIMTYLNNLCQCLAFPLSSVAFCQVTSGGLEETSPSLPLNHLLLIINKIK